MSFTPTIMFQGTGSNVGKSVLVAGFCRALANRGMRVAPFKPQNMSNNAAVALGPDEVSGGGEIGRAQWLQARACRLAPHVDMNPVLLKPQSESGAQIIVQGRVEGSATAREYQEIRSTLLSRVSESFERLKASHDVVVVEGAGSPAETNLRDGDIANMGFAIPNRVPVVLIGDIDRGGVIASLVGTHTVLNVEDREQISGFLINKFRGDVSLFDDGRTEITKHTGWRDFGVLPWLSAARDLPEEDSVWFDGSSVTDSSKSGARKCRVVVPVTSRIANFDDFNPLAVEPNVELIFVKAGQAILPDADLIVLAGSKSTIGDLGMMREQGWDQQIIAHAKRGGRVIGICGGYQMLGREIHDREGVEGEARSIDGLGLLDVVSELQADKTVRESIGTCVQSGATLEGYEIHLGTTTGPECAQAMISGANGFDGATNAAGNVRGCYLHGLFANDAWRAQLLKEMGSASSGIGYFDRMDRALDEIAEQIELHLDVDGLLDVARGN